MSTTLAQDLATETSVELAHHKEFKGRPSNAAEFVLYRAIRDDRAFLPRHEDIPATIKALAGLVRVGRQK